LNEPSNSFKHQKQQKRCDDKNDAFISTGRKKYKLIQHHFFILPQRRIGKQNNSL